jgi:flagellin
MALVVKNNMQATGTLNQLDKNANLMAKDLKKVSSGMKINSAEDDASGYSITDRMDVQTKALYQDNQNTQNGTAMLKTASGAIDSTVDILRTMKEKAIDAANDTNTDADRATIQKQLNQAIDQIDDNANVTYNGQLLIDGTKNSQVVDGGTYSTLTNTRLKPVAGYEGAVVTQLPLTYLQDSSGQPLYISKNDRVVVSYILNGVTKTATVPAYDENAANMVTGDPGEVIDLETLFREEPMNTDLRFGVDANDPTYIGVDKSGNAVHTLDGETAVNITAKNPGTDGQISGVSLAVLDPDGNVREPIDTIINTFSESIRAENSSPDNSIVLQTGTKANQNVKIGLTDMRSVALGLKANNGNTLSVATQANANVAINALDNALQKALNQQTDVGSVESRLEYTSMNITTSAENTTAAMSTIRDADMAKEMTEYTKHSILTQTAQAMLAQANTNGSAVLSLLRE